MSHNDQEPFDENGLTLIPAWISYYKPCDMCDEITWTSLSYNGEAVEI